MPMGYDSGLPSQLQPYVHYRDAYEVKSGGCIPEIGFIDIEKLYPARPEDEAYDAEGYQGINGQEQSWFLEKAPQLGEGAELDGRLTTSCIEGYSDKVHYQIHRGPEDDQPAEKNQTGPDAQNSKKELEDAKGNTDGYCLEFRCLEKTRFYLFHRLLNRLVVHISSRD